MKNTQKKKGKKGVSALVATVLLIFLTVAAVGIIWGIVLPMIADNFNNAFHCSEFNGKISEVLDNQTNAYYGSCIPTPKGCYCDIYIRRTIPLK